MKYMIIFLLLMNHAAQAETLFTKTQNGTVSLNKGLTAHECNNARKKALGIPVSPEEIKADKKKVAAIWMESQLCKDPSKGCGGGGVTNEWHIIENYDIVQAECFK